MSREQALALGLTARVIGRLVAQKHWRILGRGVYLVQPVEPSWRARAWAGVLLGGDRARVGGLAAGHLHGLVDAEPTQILVLTPADSRHRSRDGWMFRREESGVRQVRTVGSPPRITIEDTVLDLCDPRQDWSGESATHWVTRAIQRRLTTADRLLLAVRERRAVPQRRVLAGLLGDVADGAQSVLEVRYVRDVERAHGLPRGSRQNRRRAARIEGTRNAYRDVVYREFGLVVELDGRLGHVGEARVRDRRRDNVTTLRGERTLRYGWLDVTDEPCRTADQVAQGLRQGGWTSILTPAPAADCRGGPTRTVDTHSW